MRDGEANRCEDLQTMPEEEVGYSGGGERSPEKRREEEVPWALVPYADNILHEVGLATLTFKEKTLAGDPSMVPSHTLPEREEDALIEETAVGPTPDLLMEGTMASTKELAIEAMKTMHLPLASTNNAPAVLSDEPQIVIGPLAEVR